MHQNYFFHRRNLLHRWFSFVTSEHFFFVTLFSFNAMVNVFGPTWYHVYLVYWYTRSIKFIKIEFNQELLNCWKLNFWKIEKKEKSNMVYILIWIYILYTYIYVLICTRVTCYQEPTSAIFVHIRYAMPVQCSVVQDTLFINTAVITRLRVLGISK